MFISGQVKVSLDAEDNVIFKPVLTESQKGKVAYFNFDYHEPPVATITLSEEFSVDDLRGKELTMALTARKQEEGVAIYAVPRGKVANFVCQERKCAFTPKMATKVYIIGYYITLFTR